MARSVLLVDPDTERQQRMVRSLDGADFRIAAAVGDSEGALRSARITAPDVALVAAALGNGAGMDVTERLSKEHKIPVVLLALAPPTPSSMKLVAQAGVMGFLAEPISPPMLQAALEIAVCRFQEFCALQQESETLRQSVEARKVIERAKGLLMEVGHVPEREAYARMRRKSMDTQRPMVEIARAIILSAEVTLKAG